MNRVNIFLLRFKFYRDLMLWSQRTILPGFDGMPLYYVGGFFIQEIQKESLNTKATSLSFTFLLALFPGIIFLFTLIPYIPIEDFQDQLLILLSQLLPRNVQGAMETTIIQIIKQQNGGLLSIGFFTAIYFSTNGLVALMKAFNKSTLVKESRGFFRQRGLALILTFSMSILLLVGIGMIAGGEYLVDFLRSEKIIQGKLFYYFLLALRWVIILAVFFIAISMLYYYGPNNKEKFRFISAGSTLATFLVILTSLVFAFYINNFASYNKIYGSIGTLIVVMLWLYINSLILLIGFELNASISLTQLNLPLGKGKKKENTLLNT